MNENSSGSIVAPLFVMLFILASNILNRNLFGGSYNDFSIWFVIAVFCLAGGWFTAASHDWKSGVKTLLGFGIAAVIISIGYNIYEMIKASDAVNSYALITVGLNNIILAGAAFLGLALKEVQKMQSTVSAQQERIDTYKDLTEESKNQAELKIREAEIKAEKIISSAEVKKSDILKQKERLEGELKELIRTETELINKYSKLGN